MRLYVYYNVFIHYIVSDNVFTQSPSSSLSPHDAFLRRHNQRVWFFMISINWIQQFSKSIDLCMWSPIKNVWMGFPPFNSKRPKPKFQFDKVFGPILVTDSYADMGIPFSWFLIDLKRVVNSSVHFLNLIGSSQHIFSLYKLNLADHFSQWKMINFNIKIERWIDYGWLCISFSLSWCLIRNIKLWMTLIFDFVTLFSFLFRLSILFFIAIHWLR